LAPLGKSLSNISSNMEGRLPKVLRFASAIRTSFFRNKTCF
jgi:hypothetical protein